jgi:hypothetical protein
MIERSRSLARERAPATVVNMGLTKKHTLLTDATRGIGRAVAFDFAGEDADFVITTCRMLPQNLPPSLLGLTCAAAVCLLGPPFGTLLHSEVP